jgi:MFS family permease
MYGIWQASWNFSSLTLTEVYATYAFGVLAALIFFGGVSDVVGRRPVLLTALAGLLVTSGLFLLASDTWWLFLARAAQGVATGLLMAVASASLIDLHPHRNGASAGFTNGLCGALGLGVGGAVSGIIVEYTNDPEHIVFIVFAVMMLMSLVFAWRLPETVARSGNVAEALRPRMPHVPKEIRRTFHLAALAVIAAWGVGGLYFSLGPALVATLTHSTDGSLGGLFVLAVCVAGALAQFACNRASTRVVVVSGSMLLAGGSALSAWAAHGDHEWTFFVASIIVGAGFGGMFMGALRSLGAVLRPDKRANTMSAFFIVAYLAISLPAVAAGLAVQHVDLDTVATWFASLDGVVAAVVGLIAWFELRAMGSAGSH